MNHQDKKMIDLEKLIEDFKSLPEETQQQIAETIANLRTGYKDESLINIKRKISEEKFVGMWRDREDMKESTEWVRDVRKKEWKY